MKKVLVALLLTATVISSSASWLSVSHSTTASIHVSASTVVMHTDAEDEPGGF